MRRRKAEGRPVTPDQRYNNAVVARLINMIMKQGKRSTAERIVYGALEQIKEMTGKESIEVLNTAIDNSKPQVEVKSRRVGGANYQVPVEVAPERQVSLALRWIIDYSSGRKGVGMQKALAQELVDSFKGTGNAVKKRDDTHKMAQANRAFAHYRW
jgi:small subunit ribosomal protein S7